MLKYTIAFILRGDEILMLNRNYEPGLGRWNGVGGKIEQGETPLQGIIREIYEETGITVNEQNVSYTGAVTWVNEYEKSGMYAFIAEMPETFEYNTPIETDEGILCWKQKDWLFHPKNLGVLSHVPNFLPVMLSDKKLYEHCFSFNKGILSSYEKVPLGIELMF